MVRAVSAFCDHAGDAVWRCDASFCGFVVSIFFTAPFSIEGCAQKNGCGGF